MALLLPSIWFTHSICRFYFFFSAGTAPVNRNLKTKPDMADEDSTTHSQSSRSSTPNVSNPGTPRQDLSQEVRATPPLAVASATSGIQRTIPGQAQPPSTPVVPPAATAVASTAAAAAAIVTPPQQHVLPHQPQSKYSSLLAVIEDMGRDIRPTYAGNRTSSERLKRSIVHARILVRECLMECERSARTWLTAVCALLSIVCSQ